MDTMLQHKNCQHFVTYCKDIISMILDPKTWSSFSTELREVALLQKGFMDFKIFYIPSVQNWTADGLAKIVCTFHYSLIFVGYCLFRSGIPDYL